MKRIIYTRGNRYCTSCNQIKTESTLSFAVMKVMIQECGITNAINTHGEDDDYINKAKIKCLDFVH